MSKSSDFQRPSSADRGSLPSSSTAGQEVLVRVEGVSKKFCRSLKKSLWYGVCDIGAELNPFRTHIAGYGVSEMGDGRQSSNFQFPSSSSPLRPGEFWAVDDVSFELRRGECLGLIGHNGAGKTTLLKMLNGLIKPDAGKITMRGRVGALIALGAGFNPILTGRENIYINGSVLGLSKKEIDDKIEEIIEFSEVGEFIDAPVQNYSSGMQVRLGFAIASSLSPDVLILDEVLAVGDIGFVIKCLNRVHKMTENAAVILVSHNMQFISSFCSRVIFMDHGSVALDTPHSSEAIDRYYEMIRSEKNETGAGGAVIRHMALEGGARVEHGSEAFLHLEFDVDDAGFEAVVSIYIMDEAMVPVVCMPVNDMDGEFRSFGSGNHRLRLPLGIVDLVSGKYSFTIAISDRKTRQTLIRTQGLHEFRVFADRANWGRIVRPVIAK